MRAALVAREQDRSADAVCARCARLIGDMLRAPMQSFSIALMCFAGLVLLAAVNRDCSSSVARSGSRAGVTALAPAGGCAANLPGSAHPVCRRRWQADAGVCGAAHSHIPMAHTHDISCNRSA
jgi:hypothetical protein